MNDSTEATALGPLRRLARAAWLWLLGDIPELPREPGSAVLVSVVCTAAAAGMWLSERHGLHGGPMAVGAWRMLVHGCVPLAALAAWELHVARGRGQFAPAPAAIVALGVTLLLLPVALGLTKAGASALVASPALRMVLPAAVGATLVLGALRAMGARLGDWGIGLGDWRWWLPHHGVLLLALLPVIAAVTCMVPALAHYYPLYKPARTSLDALQLSLTGLAVDFVGWEFLFRGFLLFGIARRGDAVLAMLLQALPFFLMHEPKPELEMLSSYFGGVLAGWFCLRARSFLPLYVIHVAIITTVSVTAFWLRHR